MSAVGIREKVDMKYEATMGYVACENLKGYVCVFFINGVWSILVIDRKNGTVRRVQDAYKKVAVVDTRNGFKQRDGGGRGKAFEKGRCLVEDSSILVF